MGSLARKIRRNRAKKMTKAFMKMLKEQMKKAQELELQQEHSDDNRIQQEGQECQESSEGESK